MTNSTVVGDVFCDDGFDHDELGVDRSKVIEKVYYLHHVVQGALAMPLQEWQAAVIPELGQLDFVGERAAAFVYMRAKLHRASRRVLTSCEHILV